MKRLLLLLTLFFVGFTLVSVSAIARDTCARTCGKDSCSRICEGDQTAVCGCNADGTADCGCVLNPPAVDRSCSVQCKKGSCDQSCNSIERATCVCTYDIPDCRCSPQ